MSTDTRPTPPASVPAAMIRAMKWIPDTETLELTARNVRALTDKLDDPLSARTLRSPCGQIMVTAVLSAGAGEAVAAPGTLPLTRAQLVTLAAEAAEVRVGSVRVVSVADSAHYSNRLAGPMFMPSSGETR